MNSSLYKLVVFVIVSSSLLFTATAVISKNTKSSLQTRTIFLTRHAEKQNDGTHDPSLTKTGYQRAKNLITLLKNRNVTQIYSTDYKRTKQTASPLAENVNLTIKIYDPKNLKSFAQQVLLSQENVLIVGHSNTTPALVELLGGGLQNDMTESDYGLVYELEIHGSKVTTHLLKTFPD